MAMTGQALKYSHSDKNLSDPEDRGAEQISATLKQVKKKMSKEEDSRKKAASGSVIYGRLLIVEEDKLYIDEYDRAEREFLGQEEIKHQMDFTERFLARVLGQFVNAVVINDRLHGIELAED